ncbi:hypothetical protein ACA910_015306 [Epithemia clementina (nom. ined.)]
MASETSFSNEDIEIFPGLAVEHFDGRKFEGYGFDGNVRYHRRILPTCAEDTSGKGLVTMDNLFGERSCDWLRENCARFGYLCNFVGASQFCPPTCERNGTSCEST